jgi:signal transduction histidine kinase
MRQLGLQGRLVLAGLPAAAGLAVTAVLLLAGSDVVVDSPAFAGGALALAIGGLVAGIAVARHTAARLDEAAEAARSVTPATLLADLATTMATGKRPPPVAATPVDPVAAALVRVTTMLTTRALAAAYEHGEVVRATVSDAVLRLARHNQRLLDLQLSLLDDLEDAELDPDGLDRLFKLDHLATQMRRRNDALMVLTGAGSDDTHTATVAVRDVLRGAMSSVEAFTRVAIHSSAVAALRSPVASDLALLLAELIDNATRAAPSDAQVHVSATATQAGLLIEVVDDGPGFSPAELREVVALFDTRGAAPGHLPPGRRGLGLVIAARVADRNGFRVTFGTNGTTGGRATIEIPASLMTRLDADEGTDLDDAAVPIVVAQARRHDRLLARQHSQTASVATAAATSTAFVDWIPTAPRVPPSWNDAEGSVPAPTAFQPASQLSGDHGHPTGSRERSPVPASPPAGEERQQEQPLFRVAASTKSASTGLLGSTDRVAVGGLVRRVPGATRQSAGPSPRQPADTDIGPRDPDQIRARLASYRDGVARGRGGDPDRPNDRPAHEGWSQ